MAAIDKLHRAQKAKNNEFYTRYEDVKFFVENSQIKDYLKGKTVYLPCDTEESNIYKYLVDEKDNLGIKEILRTSDDYYSHLDLYEKADVVFTNPPFTNLRKWLTWLNEQNIKYISWFPMMLLYSWPTVVKSNKFISASGGGTYAKTFPPVHSQFIKPDGSLKDISIFIISNDDYFSNFIYTGNEFKKTFQEVQLSAFLIDNTEYEFSSSRHIPNDLYEPFYIPITAYIGRQDKFEYLGVYGIIGKDGKSRPRIKVKLKK